MDAIELRNLIQTELQEDTDFEGMALYSSIETLQSTSPFYIIGYNPADRGGNYSRLRDEHFQHHPWNAYFDQCWHLNDGGDCGCVASGNLKDFQKRAQRLIRALHKSDDPMLLRRTFATNAIFLASSEPRRLGDSKRRQSLWLKHWRIHQQWLRIVKPRFVIALGFGDQDSSYSLLRKQLSPLSIELKGTNQKWKAFKVPQNVGDTLGGNLEYVVGFYHLSWKPGQAESWNDFLNVLQESQATATESNPTS